MPITKEVALEALGILSVALDQASPSPELVRSAGSQPSPDLLGLNSGLRRSPGEMYAH